MISVIVPFYNEEDNIEPLYEQLSDTLKDLNRQYKIIFVDDGSTDNTFKNMLKVKEKDTNVRILKFRMYFQGIQEWMREEPGSVWRDAQVHPCNAFMERLQDRGSES